MRQSRPLYRHQGEEPYRLDCCCDVCDDVTKELHKQGIDANTPNLIGKLRDELAYAREALALIEDKLPGCGCMDTPGLAKDALRSIDESGLLK